LDCRVNEIRSKILDGFTEEIDGIQKDYKELNDKIKADGQELKARMQNLWLAIRNELDKGKPEVDESDIPTPRPASEAESLFDSTRDYLDQLAYYKNSLLTLLSNLW